MLMYVLAVDCGRGQITVIFLVIILKPPCITPLTLCLALRYKFLWLFATETRIGVPNWQWPASIRHLSDPYSSQAAEADQSPRVLHWVQGQGNVTSAMIGWSPSRSDETIDTIMALSRLISCPNGWILLKIKRFKTSWTVTLYWEDSYRSGQPQAAWMLQVFIVCLEIKSIKVWIPQEDLGLTNYVRRLVTANSGRGCVFRWEGMNGSAHIIHQMKGKTPRKTMVCSL